MSKKNKKENIEELDNNDETQVVDQEKKKGSEKSKEELLADELKQEKDKFLRLFAEFENYKKRTSKERVELFKTASQDVMVALLPVLDDFERALTHIEEDKEAEELRKGVFLIYQKLLNTLKQEGLVVMEITVGDVFDAEQHQAITQIPAPSEDLKGKIIDIVEKGYKLGEKVIRFPKVVIGQ